LLSVETQRNKILRFKAGMLFLRCLNEQGLGQRGVLGSSGGASENMQDDDAVVRML